MTGDGDFDFEPVPGLPAHLPEGEKLLWQGAPEWRDLAIRAFHVRKVAIYCGVLLLLPGAVALGDGGSVLDAAWALLKLAPLAVGAVAILAAMAWGYSWTTVYSITSRRVIIRAGVALPVTINLPFARIDSAGLRMHGDGTGDIPMALTADDRVAYLFLWPNVRPWRISKPEPMLRSIRDASRVAGILARALAAAAGVPAQPVPSTTMKPAASGGQAQPLPTAAAA